jgi:hypothetical protein
MFSVFADENHPYLPAQFPHHTSRSTRHPSDSSPPHQLHNGPHHREVAFGFEVGRHLVSCFSWSLCVFGAFRDPVVDEEAFCVFPRIISSIIFRVHDLNIPYSRTKIRFWTTPGVKSVTSALERVRPASWKAV